MSFGETLGLASTSVGLLAAAFGVWRWATSLWRRTVGSRKVAQRQLDGIACGVTISYLEERLGQPAFRRTISDRVELTWRLPHIWFCGLIGDDSLMTFAITVTDPKFRYDCRHLTFEHLPVTLGHDTLLAGPTNTKTTVSVGARRVYVTDEYYFGNPAAYQTYLLAYNDQGVGSLAANAASAQEALEANDLASGEIPRARAETTANTLVVVGPRQRNLAIVGLPRRRRRFCSDSAALTEEGTQRGPCMPIHPTCATEGRPRRGSTSSTLPRHPFPAESVMNDTLTAIGALVAIVGTLIGTLVAIDQLTFAARARRSQEWARQVVVGESNEHRVAILETIATRATAQVVASVLVPGRCFVEIVFWGLVTPASVWFVTHGKDVKDVLFFCLVAVSAAASPARRGVRVFLERQRITDEYSRGAVVYAPKLDLLNQMEGGRRREFVDAILIAIGLTALGLGLSWTFTPDRQITGLVIIAAGVVALVVGVSSVQRMARAAAAAAPAPTAAQANKGKGGHSR